MWNENVQTGEEETPSDICEAALKATYSLLPEKSRLQYDIVYNRFTEWCVSKQIQSLTENVFLAYFAERASKVKPSSLWSEYSMVKASLAVKKDMDLKKFLKLTAFMKKQSVGYHCKKAKVFSKEDVYKFLEEAPDSTYLMLKVVAIFGIAGACRRDELHRMQRCNDVEDTGTMLIIKIPTTKTNKPRSFVIDCQSVETEKMVESYRKYVSLRPSTTPHQRLFVYYRNGKCSVQPVGINSFGEIPCKIAEYLRLPNPKEYTGHSFRRSSATLLADSGTDILQLKRHGGWKSSTVAESYVEDSMKNKVDISHQILQKEPLKQISKNDVEISAVAGPSTSREYKQIPQFVMNNCSNCNITVHVTDNIETK